MSLRKYAPKSICLVMLVFFLVIPLSSCGMFFQQEPLELDNFMEVMEEKGFEVEDHTNLTPPTAIEELADLYLVAVSPCDSYQIHFIKFQTDGGAQRVFEVFRQEADAARGSVSRYSSVNMPNHNRYQMTSMGFFVYILRVEDVLVFTIRANEEHRDEIREIFDLL